ncbi:hypothetical protein F66182_4397 [Fusarium sp. NRRL 66182]|nr:hypothetical protein F66182_4397 [Fusarium sp. NRRL 66182]
MHLLTLPLFLGAVQALLVPSPLGPYHVAVKHIELVDQGRIDPFAPKANTQRRIMASAYLPVDAKYGCKSQVVPYMPPVTASVFSKVGESSLGLPGGMLEQFQMEFCDMSTARTRDVSFLISELSNTTITDSLFANFPDTFNSHKVAVYGHSFGGATAALTTQRDSRVVGGVNFDGTIYGPVKDQGFKDKPFLLVASDSPGGASLDWDGFYSKVNATKMMLTVDHTYHYAFMDIPVLLTEYKIPYGFQAKVENVFGTLSGRKVEKAVNDIMSGFLELLFRGKAKPLKDLESNSEIHVLEVNLAKKRRSIV